MARAGLNSLRPVLQHIRAAVRTPASGSAGFTLLEMMIVVLIIGVMVTFAVASIGGRTLDDGLETEARRLRELLVLAADEAVLNGTEVGFVHGTDGYRFVTLDPDAPADGPRWRPVEDDPALRPRRVPEPLYLELQVEGRAVAPAQEQDGDTREADTPHILLSSSGEVTAFSLRVRARQHVPHYLLESNLAGQMTLERKEPQ